MTRKRRIVLSSSGVEGIRSRMGHRDRTLVSVLALAGLRPGEAIALRSGDVSDRTIRVDKALAHGELKSTKNEKDRSVRLLPSLARDLNEWKMASGRPDDDRLVFPNGSGRPLERREVPQLADEVLRSRGGGCRFPRRHAYTLRHSLASLLLASGESLPEVALQMGHTVEVLTSTYAHAIAEFRGAGHIDPEEQVQKARQSLAEAV